ncbi:MAG: tetratricopeptide repeat protein [Alphaproteobacteria bacterium]
MAGKISTLARCVVAPPALSRARALALALALALAALALPEVAPAQSNSGNAGPYLAAENAARRGDISEAARLYAQALARDPDNTYLIGRTITHQMAAGQIERAIPVARRLDALRPGHHLGALLLAVDALKRGDPARARRMLASGGTEGGPFVGQLMDAWATFAEGDTDAAREMLAELEEDGTGGAAGEIVVAYHLGLLESAAGRDAEAIVAFDRAAERAGNSTLRLTRVRAGVLARLGQGEEARAAVTERLSRILGDRRLELLARDLAAGKIPAPVVRTGIEGVAESLFGVSGYLSRGDNRQIGLAYAQLAIYLDPGLVEARLLIAGLLQQDEQYELAIAAFETIPADAPEALDAEIGRAEAMQGAGRIDEAIATLRDTVAAHPRALEAHTSLGDMLRRDSQFAEAGTAYDGALALVAHPEKRHWPLFYQRGISFERSKQWPRAEADFLKALELEPDQPLVLNYLGYSWVEMGENLAEAQAMIEKAVEQRPEDGYIIDSLGWVLYRLGDFDGAAEHLERAVELKPVDPVINDHFGDALWMVGRRIEARFQWKRSLSFEPEDDNAERTRNKLAEGLDAVLAEEAAAGDPAIIQSDGTATGANANDGG